MFCQFIHRFKRKSHGFFLLLLSTFAFWAVLVCAASCAAQNFSDNFDDGVVNAAWSSDWGTTFNELSTPGKLTTNQVGWGTVIGTDAADGRVSVDTLVDDDDFIHNGLVGRVTGGTAGGGAPIYAIMGTILTGGGTGGVDVIYMHEFIDGAFGPRLGQIDMPGIDLTREVHMDLIIIGSDATFAITDANGLSFSRSIVINTNPAPPGKSVPNPQLDGPGRWGLYTSGPGGPQRWDNFRFVVIPEPSTVVLAMLASLGLGYARRARRML